VTEETTTLAVLLAERLPVGGTTAPGDAALSIPGLLHATETTETLVLADHVAGQGARPTEVLIRRAIHY
jgi:hypothetical protein